MHTDMMERQDAQQVAAVQVYESAAVIWAEAQCHWSQPYR